MTYKILVVDDERMIKMLFEFQFLEEIEAQSYEFIFAYNGQEALNILEKDAEIAILITDIRMPKMDGFALMEQLKQKQIYLPIFVVSAYDKSVNLEQAQKLGAREFFDKPIDFNYLKNQIITALKK
jgi:CheY-like chemotaxis protein